MQAPAEATRGAATGFSCPAEVAARIATLYGDERLADVTFVVKRGEGSPARRFVGHRNIVSTWSVPLDRMLCGSFAEGSSHEVHIQDVEPAAFEAMLKMMYCGSVEITVDNVLAILDVSVRFDVAPLVQFSVQFLQSHTSSEHACWMLDVGVQYGLVKLVDRCIELIVTDDHILESEDLLRLSQAAMVELARHDAWNMHEDEIYDTFVAWSRASSSSAEERRQLLSPILEHLRYPLMSKEKLKSLKNEVPHDLLFEALFFKLEPSAPSQPDTTGRYRQRAGSLLFGWVQTPKVTVNGDRRENARHTCSHGFTGVRGDRYMQHGSYSWLIDVTETQQSWIFVGVVQADDVNDVAWRSTGRMLYCLDSRFFHQGSGQNHPGGDRKVVSGDTIRVVLDCKEHTLAFGVNDDRPQVLFRDLPPVAYLPAVDLRDCGDKVRILSSRADARAGGAHGDQGLVRAAGREPLRRQDVLGAGGGPHPAAARQALPPGPGSAAPRDRRSEPAGDIQQHAERAIAARAGQAFASAAGAEHGLAGRWPSGDFSFSPTRRATVTGGEAHALQPAAHGPGPPQGAAEAPRSAAGHGGAAAGGADRGAPGGGHAHAAPSGSDARRVQPRQAPGPQSGVPQDRAAGPVSVAGAAAAVAGGASAAPPLGVAAGPPPPDPALPEEPGGREAVSLAAGQDSPPPA